MEGRKDMTEKLLSRAEVPKELTWDLTLIYKSEELMWNDLEECKRIVAHMEETYKGHLDTPENIVACMKELERLNELATLIGNYTSLAVSVDSKKSSSINFFILSTYPFGKKQFVLFQL